MLIKNFKKFGILKSSINKCRLASFSNTYTIDLYPDQIVDKLKTTIGKQNDDDLTTLEANILDNIHFFDADQFVDLVSILAMADKGTEGLWDILSRKVFDYDLDLIQTYMLDEALQHCNKQDFFMVDQIARDNLVWQVKWPKQSAVFKNKLL